MTKKLIALLLAVLMVLTLAACKGEEGNEKDSTSGAGSQNGEEPTLSDEENWRKTHRLAGIVMVCGGVLMMITALIGSVWLMLGLLIVMILIPVVYSFADYRKNHP